LLVHIGDTYLQESRPKKAETFYTQVKKSFPGSEGASIAELRLGDLHGDVNKFKEVEKKQPNAPIAEIATLKVADAYYKSGQYQKAMETLKELTEKAPKDSMLNAARSLFGQAAEKAMEDLFKQGKFSEVIALFRANEALLKGKIGPGKQILVARSLQEVKDYSGAISAFRDLDPADLSTDKKKAYYLGLADCLWLSGLPADSIRVLEGARKAGLSSENKLAVTRSLAGRYAEEKRFNEAYQLYAAIIQGKKNLDTKQMADCYLSMGEVLNAQGKYQEARAVLNRSIALSERTKALKPVLLSSLGKLGESYLKEGRYQDALKAYTQALGGGYEKGKPGFWDVKLGQAEALMKMGERTVADNVLNGIYEERGPDPRYWDLRFRLAQEYVKAGNLQTGEKLLREVSEEGTPALQSDAQIKLGSLSLRKQLEKLSIWPQLGDQKQRHVGQ
jgi:tetratricopeptide (TPR) repeat protein